MALRFKIEIPLSFMSKNALDPSIFAPKIKYISYVCIEGRFYNKPRTRDSIKVMNFYNFVIDNRNSINKIKMQNGDTYYLKKSKLHSLKGTCMELEKHGSWLNKIYAINGVVIPEEKHKLFERFVKVEHLTNKMK